MNRSRPMTGMSPTAPGDRGGSMSRDGRPDPATEAFLAHRNLLFTVAYEMLGSAADAEDVLQETWLRWAGVDLGTVRDQRAYLVRITTRQALGRLRTLGRRKESYVGPWLPEPLLTTPDVAEDVELADSVSMAMLLVLETLTPNERAVFVLREVFDLAYDEIAEAVGKSPAAVTRRGAPAAWGGIRGRDPGRARRVPAGGRNGRSAELARYPRAGRRLPGRRRRSRAGRAGARRGGRPGGPLAGHRAGQDRRHGLAAADAGQRLPGADHPVRRRDRHRHRGTHRRRPRHRALRRAQPREAVAYGTGDHPAPLSPGPKGPALSVIRCPQRFTVPVIWPLSRNDNVCRPPDSPHLPHRHHRPLPSASGTGAVCPSPRLSGWHDGQSRESRPGRPGGAAPPCLAGTRRGLSAAGQADEAVTSGLRAHTSNDETCPRHP